MLKIIIKFKINEVKNTIAPVFDQFRIQYPNHREKIDHVQEVVYSNLENVEPLQLQTHEVSYDGLCKVFTSMDFTDQKSHQDQIKNELQTAVIEKFNQQSGHGIKPLTKNSF